MGGRTPGSGLFGIAQQFDSTHFEAVPPLGESEPVQVSVPSPPFDLVHGYQFETGNAAGLDVTLLPHASSIGFQVSGESI